MNENPVWNKLYLKSEKSRLKHFYAAGKSFLVEKSIGQVDFGTVYYCK